MNNDEADALMREIMMAIQEQSGGHAVTNLRGDTLWSSKHPINMTMIVEIVAHHYRERAEKAEKLLAQALGLSCSAMSFLKEAQALKRNEGL